MAEEIKPGENLPQQGEVATMVIHCNVKTGKVEVGGHLDNLFLNLQMLAVAGNMLIERNAELLRKAAANGKPH